jgi:hypothetical protein
LGSNSPGNIRVLQDTSLCGTVLEPQAEMRALCPWGMALSWLALGISGDPLLGDS